MKTPALTMLVGLIACRLAADPTMHEKITAALADSDHATPPPRTAHDFAKAKEVKADLVEGTIQLPDFEVTAPLIPNKQKIELQLAKNQVAQRQEEANLVPTVLDRVFGMGRIASARERLKFLQLQETVILSSLATSEADGKELMRLLAKDRYPTLR
ncbi:MAG TPA: hypothetical protein VFJ90_09130 [Candidatus Didemnitutus sp.]|nr:hypothetical protein [Candidatus Didemnitutus sp.]